MSKIKALLIARAFVAKLMTAALGSADLEASAGKLFVLLQGLKDLVGDEGFMAFPVEKKVILVEALIGKVIEDIDEEDKAFFA